MLVLALALHGRLALKAGGDWDLQCGTDPAKWSYNKLGSAMDQGTSFIVVQGPPSCGALHVKLGACMALLTSLAFQYTRSTLHEADGVIQTRNHDLTLKRSL